MVLFGHVDAQTSLTAAILKGMDALQGSTACNSTESNQ